MTLARRLTLLAVVAAFAACDSESPVSPSPHTAPSADPLRLALPTYDGSGEAVHPDVLHLPGGWRGWEYWMAVTPYPRGNAGYENPSILVSHDGETWTVPTGLSNPVVPAPSAGYNSDPDLVYDAVADRLVLVYREVAGGFNLIRSVASPDGVAWSAASTLFRVPNHRAISPALATVDPARPMAWYVDAGTVGCGTRSATVKLRLADGPAALTPAAVEAGWSAERPTTLELPGFVLWHLDVVYHPARREYWAIFPAFPVGRSCGEGDLYLARSPDGVQWTVYPTAFLTTRVAEWTHASLYRASALLDGGSDRLAVWFSARAADGRWSVGLVAYEVPELLAALAAGREPIRVRYGRPVQASGATAARLGTR
jgi:hypothetical protein